MPRNRKTGDSSPVFPHKLSCEALLVAVRCNI